MSNYQKEVNLLTPFKFWKDSEGKSHVSWIRIYLAAEIGKNVTYRLKGSREFPLIPKSNQTHAMSYLLGQLLEIFAERSLFIHDEVELEAFVNEFSYDPDLDIPEYFEFEDYENIIWPLQKCSDEAKRIMDN